MQRIACRKMFFSRRSPWGPHLPRLARAKPRREAARPPRLLAVAHPEIGEHRQVHQHQHEDDGDHADDADDLVSSAHAWVLLAVEVVQDQGVWRAAVPRG
jgi:hypothetical protein